MNIPVLLNTSVTRRFTPSTSKLNLQGRLRIVLNQLLSRQERRQFVLAISQVMKVPFRQGTCDGYMYSEITTSHS